MSCLRAAGAMPGLLVLLVALAALASVRAQPKPTAAVAAGGAQVSFGSTDLKTVLVRLLMHS